MQNGLIESAPTPSCGLCVSHILTDDLTYKASLCAGEQAARTRLSELNRASLFTWGRRLVDVLNIHHQFAPFALVFNVVLQPLLISDSETL